MIRVKKVKKESRTRDRNRKRLFLEFGKVKIHITQDEALVLLRSLAKLILKKQDVTHV